MQIQKCRHGQGVGGRSPAAQPQFAHHAQRANAIAERHSARREKAGKGVQGSGQARRAQAKCAVERLQVQGQAQEQGVQVGAGVQPTHQRHRFGIGAEHQVLAVVDRAEHRVVDASRTPAHRARRLEDRDILAGAPQRERGRQPSPSGADDRNPHAHSALNVRACRALGQDGFALRLIRRTMPLPPATQLLHASHSLRTGVSEIRWCSTCQCSRSISSSSVK